MREVVLEHIVPTWILRQSFPVPNMKFTTVGTVRWGELWLICAVYQVYEGEGEGAEVGRKPNMMGIVIW